jgi:hypothetical protein
VEDLTLKLKPKRILDRSEKVLRNKKILMIKVLWKNSQVKEHTWEKETEMKRKYPELFADSGKKFKFKDEIFFKKGRI